LASEDVGNDLNFCATALLGKSRCAGEQHDREDATTQSPVFIRKLSLEFGCELSGLLFVPDRHQRMHDRLSLQHGGLKLEWTLNFRSQASKPRLVRSSRNISKPLHHMRLKDFQFPIAGRSWGRNAAAT
jgi:hypothetical protein